MLTSKTIREIRHDYRMGKKKNIIMELYLVDKETLEDIIKDVEVIKEKKPKSHGEDNIRHCRIRIPNPKTWMR